MYRIPGRVASGDIFPVDEKKMIKPQEILIMYGEKYKAVIK